MNRAFRFLAIGLLAVGLLASCKKNNNGDSPTNSKVFKATVESNVDGSKTSLQGLNVVWTEGDLINVANASGSELVFQLTSDPNYAYGEFGSSGASSYDFTQPFKAVYPATNPANTANTISGITATINLPATQNILADGTFGVGYNPMVAYSTDHTLPFKNLCGALRFQMVGSGITVKTLVLTTGNSSDRLSGTFTANCTNATMSHSSGGGNTITLTCPGSGIALDGTVATNFYFMLPPGTLHGVTFTAKNGSGETVYTQTSTKNFTITRNKIIPVNELEVPLKVTTTSPTDMEITTAKGGVTSVTNGTPVETGICWGTSPEPIPDPTSTPPNYKAGAVGTTINMTDLTPGTDYYVRAYAKTAKGNYYYGTAILFATKTNYDAPAAGVPTGGLPYVFSVSSSQKVYFSRGNLQYQASTDTWRFAEDQWVFVGSWDGPDGAPRGMLSGSNNQSTSSSYSGWIDCFGWGTSGNNHNGKSYQPYSTSSDYNQYQPYNSTSSNLYTSPGTAEWGTNKISNGGNTANSGWRTWTSAEMVYLLDSRSQTYRFAQAQIDVPYPSPHDNLRGANGLLIFPDGFTWPSELSGLTLTCNDHTGPSFYNDNHITEQQWSILEKYGVAFLPAGGGRNGTTCFTQGRACRYWTSSRATSGNTAASAQTMDFGDHYWNVPSVSNLHSGLTVRLIKNK